jgi:hypothetical protein
VSPAVAAVTLQASRMDARFGGRRSAPVTFSGEVATGAGGVAGVRVQLAGRSAAYDRTVVRRTVTTDAAGRFSVRLRPPTNAAWRATVVDGQTVTGTSARRRVLVSPRLVLRSKGRDVGVVLRLTAQAPARVPIAGSGATRRVRAGAARRAVFYLRLRGETRYRRFGSGRLAAAHCGATCTRTATVVVRDRALLRRTRAVGACTRGLAFRGFGESTPCGAARRVF